MSIKKFHKLSRVGNSITVYQRCIKCNMIFGIKEMIMKCTKCRECLEYVFDGKYNGKLTKRNDQWKNFDLMPLMFEKNIVSLNEGASRLIELTDLKNEIGGARLFIKLDNDKNPTGTFKDREASLIISRCKELGLDNLVFYSTGNTGRAYTHYAAHAGLTTYFFMPKESSYKITDSIRKNKNNFIISIDEDYPEVGPYAKKFAAENNLTLIAPLHDRIEAYATLAYEQFQQMPKCNFFAQTIASGMGAIGFYRGHKNLIKFGLEKETDMPRIITIQSSQTNYMYKAYIAGKGKMAQDDLPRKFPKDLFEPTLNSTNPINNYPVLFNILKDSNGIIIDVSQRYVKKEKAKIIKSLAKQGVVLRDDLEKSILIGYAGLVKLAKRGVFNKNDNIFFMGTGRGNDISKKLILPDIMINPRKDHPKNVKRKLDELLNK